MILLKLWVQCSAMQCSVVQCSAVQCSAAQCSAVQCSAGFCESLAHPGSQRKDPKTYLPSSDTKPTSFLLCIVFTIIHHKAQHFQHKAEWRGLVWCGFSILYQFNCKWSVVYQWCNNGSDIRSCGQYSNTVIQSAVTVQPIYFNLSKSWKFDIKSRKTSMYNASQNTKTFLRQKFVFGLTFEFSQLLKWTSYLWHQTVFGRKTMFENFTFSD